MSLTKSSEFLLLCQVLTLLGFDLRNLSDSYQEHCIACFCGGIMMNRATALVFDSYATTNYKHGCWGEGGWNTCGNTPPTL